MNKTRYKRILGLFILAFVMLLVSVPNVYAADDCRNDFRADEYFAKKYGIDIDIKQSKGKWIYELSCNATKESTGMTDDEFKKVKFRLDSVFSFDAPVDSEVTVKTARSIRANSNNKAGVNYNVIEGKSLKDYTDTIYLTPGKKIKFTRGGSLKDGRQGLHFTLYPEGFMDPAVESCAKKIADGKNITLEEVTREFFVEQIVVADDSDTGLKTIKDSSTISSSCSSSMEKVDCSDYQNKYPNKASFEYKFCYAKENAKSTKKFNVKSEEEMTKVWEKKEPFSFKCAYDYDKWEDNQTEEVLNDDSRYYRKENRNYLHAEVTYQKTAGTYVYNYEYGTEKEDAVCTISCEEAVTVEYGAPVLSTAGMCFQYKVKVTSRVTCGLGDTDDNNGDKDKDATKTTTKCEDIKKPRSSKLCSPRPYCKHPGGGVYLQGGPNDAFDECINECDKGKYTDKCVNRCYKKVYGNSTKNTNLRKSNNSSDLALYDTVKVTSSAPGNFCAKDDKGNYIPHNDGNGNMIRNKMYCYDSNGKVKWVTGTSTRNVANSGCTKNPYRVDTDSTWHQTNNWGTTTCSGYTNYTDNGIPKTATCNDECSWIGCDKGSYGDDDFYINEESAKQDDKYNEEVYQNLIEQCKASIGCTTTTSEYTISADVKTGPNEGDKITINFPFSTNQDMEKAIKEKHTKLEYDKIQANGTKKQNVTDTSKDSNTTILQRNFCYNEPSSFTYEDNKRKDHIEYQTEWSFPGTWMENKLKYTTYQKPDDLDGFTAFDKQFCIPSYAGNTNVKWGRYSFYKLHKNQLSSYSVKDTEYLNDIECKKEDHTNYSEKATTVINSVESFTKADAAKIDWNINASTKKFGHFGWYINMSCFYSVIRPGDEETNGTKEGSTETSTYCKQKEPYKVRSVDLKNLFPSKDGTTLSSSTETGRSPGFNWSEHADQTTKNEDYKSLPKEYTKYVQELGYSVYNDNYLDYYIWLSKDNITKIRKEKHKLDSFDSEMKDVVDSVTHYQSSLIRGNTLKESHYPKGHAVSCNNMKNYSSEECEKKWEVK